MNHAAAAPAPMNSDATAAPLLGDVLDPAAVDETVRVQDDLFRHVNGTWLANAVIPADRPATSSFVELRDAAEEACHTLLEELSRLGGPGDGPAGPMTSADKIAALYSSFMDEERIEALGAAPLEEDLVPVVQAADKEALAEVLGAGVASGLTGAFAIGVENDLNDPDRYTTWLSQSGLGLPDESYYREEAHEQLRQDYLAHIARMMALADLPGRLHLGADEIARKVMAVETSLAKGHWDRVACRDIEKMNNPRSWVEITGSAPGFGWGAWRDGVDRAVRAAGAETGQLLQHTIVTQPDYLVHAAKIWDSTSLTDLRAWASWHVVHSRATLLSSDFVNENFSFYSHRLNGVDELRARWKRGVSLIEGTLGEALGELYVARHFPPEHKAAMKRLVADLIEAYRESISSLEWMGRDTRERALEKLSLFNPKIGYPSTWRDYSPVVVTPGDVLASVRSVEAFDLARAVRKLAGPVDREEWHMTPQTVNAYYNPTMNEIVFPAAILQPPFFDPQADDAVNYAGIGAVIGHEIGHGFDDQGSTFDGHGKVSDWWTAEDREAFTARTRALIAQYDAFRPSVLLERARRQGTPVEEVPHVNGALTIGENIGDLGGLGIALKAYLLALGRQGITSPSRAPVIDGLSAMERFFYSWARIWRGKNRPANAALLLTVDPHSPLEFRCNGIVRNMDAFHDAFGVREGDGMWLEPGRRVTIW